MSGKMVLKERYQLEEEIGRGAFATVHRARDLLLQRSVAVKMLRPELLALHGPGVINQFQQEAQAVAQFQHSHVVHLYDVGESGSQFFLVMEYLAGGDLARRLNTLQEKGERLSLAETIRLLTPLADALEAAHRAGLVHRDVKPANVLFRADGQPVLTDFGLVKVAQHSLSMSPLSANIVLGTPGYMAPEQIDETLGGITPATDLFALAVVAYELLTGKIAFVGNNTNARNYQTVHADRAKLLALLPADLPPAVRQGLQTGLTIAPSQRPTQPTAWLRAWGDSRPVTSAPVSVPSNKENPADIEWVEIPAGSFWFGEKEKGEITLSQKISRIFKPHNATIAKPYFIGKYPVTNAQYQRFIDVNLKYAVPKHWDANRRTYPIGKGNHPVVYVNYNDAEAFCAWGGYRLPTELEWEKAARGEDGRVYPWGNKFIDGICNVEGGGTTAVDQFPGAVSPYGVWDMSGNVWEWTIVAKDNSRAWRGGSWANFQGNARAAYRYGYFLRNRDPNVGFRVVCGRVPHSGRIPEGG